MAIPSAEQLSLAHEVADALGKQLDPDWLEDELKLSMWTKSNQGKIIEKLGLAKISRGFFTFCDAD